MNTMRPTTNEVDRVITKTSSSRIRLSIIQGISKLGRTPKKARPANNSLYQIEYEEDAAPFVMRNYRLTHIIGQGTSRVKSILSNQYLGDYATVYKALDLTNDTICAVKVMSTSGPLYSEDRFVSETASLNLLAEHNSQFSLRMIDSFHFKDESAPPGLSDCDVVVTNLVGEFSLQDRLEQFKGPMPVSEAQMWFSHLVRAIDECHSIGVFHRDIKPANVFLNIKNRELILGDFGSSIFSTDPQDATPETVGSPAFTAPELAAGLATSIDLRAVDIWSLGITLYSLLVGETPFHAANVYCLFKQISTEDPVIPQKLDNNIASLLRGMLARDPNSRLTISEIMDHPWVKLGHHKILNNPNACIIL